MFVCENGTVLLCSKLSHHTSHPFVVPLGNVVAFPRSSVCTLTRACMSITYCTLYNNNRYPVPERRTYHNTSTDLCVGLAHSLPIYASTAPSLSKIGHDSRMPND